MIVIRWLAFFSMLADLPILWSVASIHNALMFLVDISLFVWVWSLHIREEYQYNLEVDLPDGTVYSRTGLSRERRDAMAFRAMQIGGKLKENEK